MRADVLKVIGDAKDITNVVILTHNIDFIFIQSLVIPALRKCGSPSLTILADAECAVQTYQDQAKLLNNLGRRYRVVPVAMQAGFRFHPKAILLSGPDKATLLVGSGNLTFGGWRENGEIWLHFDTETDGNGIFADFHSYLNQVAKLCPHFQEVFESEIAEAFDPATRSWAAAIQPAGQLLGRAGQGTSLLALMKEVVGERTIDRLLVCTPYFDAEAKALQTFSRDFGSPPTTVLLQSKQNNLLSSAAAGLGPGFTLKKVSFVRELAAGSKAEEGPASFRNAFIHAKFYALWHDDEVTVFAGSANCSQAALTIPGSAGNAELMSHFTISRDEFEQSLMTELNIEETVPELQSTFSDPPPVEPENTILRILSARMETGQLQVAYVASVNVKIIGGRTAEEVLAPVASGQGWVRFETNRQPGTLMLLGSDEGKEICSLPHWVDDEHALRVSARGRSLAESINSKVREEAWGIGAWTEVLHELYKHMQYLPKVSTRSAGNEKGASAGKKDPAEFEWGDVFSDGYGLAFGVSNNEKAYLSPERRVDGLRLFLLRWLNVSSSESESDEESGAVSLPVSKMENLGQEDRINKFLGAEQRSRVKEQTPAKVSLAQRKKALKLVGLLTDRLSDPEFLSERQPESLGIDLKITSALFRAGLADGWLTDQEFFDASLKIWLPMFFNADHGERYGWLELKYHTAPDRKLFADAIMSSGLAAALGCWALSTPSGKKSPQQVRFDLASILAVARLPWLWQTGGNKNLSREIADLLAYTPSGRIDWQSIEQRWLTLIRRGYALSCLEKALSAYDIADLRDRLRQQEVEAGELLWQQGLGFCVARHACNRKIKMNCEVLILHKNGMTKKFLAPFITPVTGLVENGVMDDALLMPKVRKELQKLAMEFKYGPEQ